MVFNVAQHMVCNGVQCCHCNMSQDALHKMHVIARHVLHTTRCVAQHGVQHMSCNDVQHMVCNGVQCCHCNMSLMLHDLRCNIAQLVLHIIARHVLHITAQHVLHIIAHHVLHSMCCTT